MKPWCDRPGCGREFPHDHPPQAPDSPSGASVRAVRPVTRTVTPPKPQTAAQRPAEESLTADSGPGTSTPPTPEDEGGAAPEVETGGERDVSTWRARWATVTAEVDAAEVRLGTARQRRLELLGEMRQTMSLGQIAEVTGLTRQRVGQLLANP